MPEEVELLQTLIKNACVNDGGPGVSEVATADDIHSVLAGCGLDIEVFDAAAGRRSIVARLPGTDPSAPTLMLLGHTDVVPVIRERWTHDPFGGELIDGFVWGRGALDMLGHVATMALALRDHAQSGRHRGGDVVMAAVADEEALGALGTQWLIANQPEAMQADWVVTETGGSVSKSPTGLTMSALAAEKGAWRVRLTLTGDPGHTSMPAGGVNALRVAAEICVRLSDHVHPISITEPWRTFVEKGCTERVRGQLLDPDLVDVSMVLLPPFAAKVVHALTRMTAVVTSITTEGSWNTVPARAVIEVDVRVLPGQGLSDIEAFIAQALGPLSTEVSITVVAGSAATSSPTGTPLWELMQRAAQVQLPGVTLVPTMAPGATDARFYRDQGAIAYGFGMYSDRLPVESIPSMLHGDDERVDVQSLSMMRRLWSDLLTMHADYSESVR